MRRIGWQGQTRTLLVRDQLEERFQHWREGWFGTRTFDAHVVAQNVAGDMETPLDCWHKGRGGACMWVEAPADAPSQLAAAVLQIEAVENALARTIGESCIADLFLTLWGDRTGGAFEPTEPPSSQCREARYGGVALRVVGLPFELRLLVDRGWCEEEVAPKPSPRPVLTDRRTALGVKQLALKAVVDLGEIPLLESMAWSPGELLVTDASHVLPVKITLGGQTIRTGVLGKRAGQRAIEIS